MKQLFIVLCLFFLPSLSINRVFAQKTPFNVVIINTDDVGYGDLNCYGAISVKTPNTDRLVQSIANEKGKGETVIVKVPFGKKMP
jgi:hypothetical protein